MNDAVAVVTATSVEAKAARRAMPNGNVIEAGIALSHAERVAGQSAVISCGLAGGLSHLHPTGTVVIPYEVLRPDGTTLQCDRTLVESLIGAARARGTEPITEPIVTTARIVTGAARRAWSERGYAAVDMETGLLGAARVAAVRVVLDTPLRELSEEWLRPARAMLNPLLWPEAIWLARHGPRCAALAAEIVRDALSVKPNAS
jgi:phosphorylase superfamily protein